MIEIQNSLKEVWLWSMEPWKNLLRSSKLRLAKRKYPAAGRELTKKLALDILLRLCWKAVTQVLPKLTGIYPVTVPVKLNGKPSRGPAELTEEPLSRSL